VAGTQTCSSEQQKIRYVLRDGAFHILTAALVMAFSHPLAILPRLVLALRMSRGSDHPLLVHLAYLMRCRN
jgi:hypothetical protein